MNAYLLLAETDDECDLVLSRLTRFSVRTAGCFGAYAAVTVESVEELRDVTERLGEISPGRIDVLLAVEASAEVAPTQPLSGVPSRCIDPKTGEIDWSCLGSPQPSVGPKASYFAVAVVQVGAGDRDAAYEQIAASGGVTGLTRLAEPDRLLVELGGADAELLMRAVDTLSSLPTVRSARTAFAVRPLELDAVESA